MLVTNQGLQGRLCRGHGTSEQQEPVAQELFSTSSVSKYFGPEKGLSKNPLGHRPSPPRPRLRGSRAVDATINDFADGESSNRCRVPEPETHGDAAEGRRVHEEAQADEAPLELGDCLTVFVVSGKIYTAAKIACVTCRAIVR